MREREEIDSTKKERGLESVDGSSERKEKREKKQTLDSAACIISDDALAVRCSPVAAMRKLPEEKKKERKKREPSFLSLEEKKKGKRKKWESLC